MQRKLNADSLPGTVYGCYANTNIINDLEKTDLRKRDRAVHGVPLYSKALLSQTPKSVCVGFVCYGNVTLIT